jgi:hypothetical protein
LKAKSVLTLLLLLYFFILIPISSCYSVEFKPEADYPVLRETEVDKVFITWAYPGPNIVPIGTLLIRDFSGDISDPAFLTYIRRQARKYGAPGAYIQERRILNVDSIHTDYSGGRQNSISRNGSGPQGNILKTDVGIVSVMLFTYKK